MWDGVQSVFRGTDPQARRAAWNFMIASAEGNYDYLGPLRAVFFRAIELESRDFGDMISAAQLLVRLTADGRDIGGMEADIARVLHGWITMLVSMVNQSLKEAAKWDFLQSLRSEK